MTSSQTIIALPYVVNILLKLSSLILDRRVLISSLEDLAALPKPPGTRFDLTSDQREVIAEYVSHASLKSTTVLTSVTSGFVAVVIIISNQPVSWLSWSMALVMLLAFSLVVWVLPRKVYYFSMRTRVGLDRGTVLVLLFCLYDVLLAALSLATIPQPSVPKPGVPPSPGAILF